MPLVSGDRSVDRGLQTTTYDDMNTLESRSLVAFVMDNISQTVT